MEVQPLMAQLNGSFEVLRIEQQPLGATITASISQRRWSA